MLGTAADGFLHAAQLGEILQHDDVARAAEVRPHHTKFRHEHIEGCCFVAEGLLATAESREIYLFTDEHFRALKQKE